MHTLSFVSDFVCPWCYIGKARLDQALAELDLNSELQMRFLPFKLNPGIPPGGMLRKDYRIQKFGSIEKSNELDLQVRMAAEESGIVIDHEKMMRTPHTLKAHMLMAMAANIPTKAEDTAAELADRLFASYFVEGLDIGETDTLLDVAEGIGIPRDISAAALDDQELMAATDSLADGLAQQGISGVPTLLLDQHFFLSGAVPTDDLKRMIPEALAILESA